MRIFLESCCLYPAIRSPGGGSARILLEAKKRGFIIVTTPMVLEETKLHVTKDLGERAIFWLYNLIESQPDHWDLIENPSNKELKRWEKITVEKDLHVLAGAIKGKADVLVTLDRKHLLTAAVRTAFPIPVKNTKEFWKPIRESEKD